MEARISDRLRIISSFRQKYIVEKIQQYLSSNYWQFLSHGLTPHITLASTTLSVITSVYAHTRSVTLFSFHPVFMSVGAILLIGQGIIAYRNKLLLEALSPIMQHNKMTKVRAIHQTCQVLGASFLFLGLMFIFANKIEFNESLIPKSIHSITGSILLLIIIGQVISGDHKLSNYARSNMTIRRWHGDAGFLVWDMICTVIVLGLFEYLGISLLFLLDTFLIMVCWYIIQLQLLKKSMIEEESQSKEGSNLEADASTEFLPSSETSQEIDEFQP